MQSVKFFAAAALGLTATLAQAAGFRFIEVPAGPGGSALKGAMWYPCVEPPGAIEVGPFTVFGAKDCPLTGGALPLVVISHGMGGSFTDHHDLAETLADAGFVVAAIDHPGDTFLDKSRIGDLSVMVERPTDIKRVTDFMLSAAPAASDIDAQRIGLFGFSAGGYTGLVLIGADPDWAVPLCRRSPTPPACEQILRKQFRVEPLAHDSRIKAAVIADPCCAWLTADSFSALKVPVQLWASMGVGTPDQLQWDADALGQNGRRAGQGLVSRARISRRAKLDAFRVPIRLPARGCVICSARDLHRCAGLRPCRVPQRVQCGSAGVLPR